tara:strand:+ start:212 stop:490 length:279 start_codon:yes stop_codon:yes gene_type:complete
MNIEYGLELELKDNKFYPVGEYTTNFLELIGKNRKTFTDKDLMRLNNELLFALNIKHTYVFQRTRKRKESETYIRAEKLKYYKLEFLKNMYI